MTDHEKMLKKLKSSVAEAFPEANDHDAMLMSGFVALYCTATEEVKIFLKAVIIEALADAKKIHARVMDDIKNKIEELEDKEVREDIKKKIEEVESKGKKSILN